MKALSAFFALLIAAGPVQAGQWTVDYARSRLGFTVMWGKEPFSAVFKSWKADIDFEPNDPAHARVDVTVMLDSEISDEPDFDDGLKGAMGFQVSQFPLAHFVATDFARKGSNSYLATGRLSLKGISRPLTLPFTLAIENGRAHMKGSADVIRTDFEVGQGVWAAPTPVAHNVTVTIDLYATRP